MRVKLELHLTWKNTLSLVTGACVVGLAVIPLKVDATHLSWLRWQIAIFVLMIAAIAALLVQAILQSKEDYQRDERERERDKTLDGIKAQLEDLGRAKHPIAQVQSVGTEAVLAVSQAQDALQQTPTIDGVVYRLVISPRTMAWEIVRDVFKMQGRADEAKVDCDLLVEMYLVNTSESEIVYVKDIDVSVDIKGQRQSLKLQKDFEADEFNDQPFEYALQVDRFSEKETLPRLLPANTPVALAPRQPLEGWARFLADSINPDMITPHSVQIKVIDSLGKEYPISKSIESKTKDREICLRRLRN